MTDDELLKFIDAHRDWPEDRLIAFVKANMEFDEEAERTAAARRLVIGARKPRQRGAAR
jgi:hypothetical protein